MNKNTPVIEARGLVKKFGAFTAVDDVSFQVEKGEFFGLLGPNGAGKTSVIRMMYGFSPLTAGSMKVFGQDIQTGWRQIRSRTGVCQQENTLDPDLTVEQNLLVFAGYYRMPGKRAVERTRELLDFFALKHKKNAQVSQLSGGMARRLMLARSLINDPGLIILDEPTTGLDPQSRHQVWDKLRDLQARGLTLVLTTHYMEEAASLCHRLVIVDKGKILVQGTPEALIREHAGTAVIEVDNPGQDLLGFVEQNKLRHEVLPDRLVVYTDDLNGLGQAIRQQFCPEKCLFRSATLEDVFLRLTGRELRE
ncbi:ABC transporter ATP-binding protein [Desulfonatronovibrio hydrogenovorans]|uniref:ABC transporter ATP-binding protein n=1 Tax=Desulfonatronovibrio hydrogenovorans TaxID=53245 RepID=UPI00048DF97B|nr:ABC transporter ATP-binding protein [Desulfonatronovibrio hydrogenovorans]